MKEQKNLGEIEFEVVETGKTFWWPQCQKEGCQASICLGLSEKFCYPHSAWYRPFVAKINALKNWIEDKFSKPSQFQPLCGDCHDKKHNKI